MKYDPTKTQLDMVPPRFDVGGNRITGEHDHEVTPSGSFEKYKLPRESQLTFDNIGGYFCIGVGLGMILYGIGWMILGG